MNSVIKSVIDNGTVIPASPLALTSDFKLDERRQRALIRYYAHSGAGGIAIAVHTTQFEIREAKIGLFKPVLELTKDEMDSIDKRRSVPLVRIGGICGKTDQAVKEAEILSNLGYHAGLLNLGALKTADDETIVQHCQKVSETLPLIGFYLQPAVGGRILSYSFWRKFAEIDNVAAIKIACFNRYKTIDVARAIAESGRNDIALYTGNDDSIVMDLITPYRFKVNGNIVEKRIVGGLLGHWSVWTKTAVELLKECKEAVQTGVIDQNLLAKSVAITDCNSVIFDSINEFSGCIAGIHEILRRQGFFEEINLLEPNEGLSKGQADEIDRILKCYPSLFDTDFVKENINSWLNR